MLLSGPLTDIRSFTVNVTLNGNEQTVKSLEKQHVRNWKNLYNEKFRNEFLVDYHGGTDGQGMLNAGEK